MPLTPVWVESLVMVPEIVPGAKPMGAAVASHGAVWPEATEALTM